MSYLSRIEIQARAGVYLSLFISLCVSLNLSVCVSPFSRPPTQTHTQLAVSACVFFFFFPFPFRLVTERTVQLAGAVRTSPRPLSPLLRRRDGGKRIKLSAKSRNIKALVFSESCTSLWCVYVCVCVWVFTDQSPAILTRVPASRANDN